MTVADLPADVIFISDSQDVAAVKEYIGTKASDYDSFFVRIVDGDYHAAYGLSGIVPWLRKPIDQIL